MIKIVVGTRPEIIKLTPVINRLEDVEVLFTGQHFSDSMSSVFLDKIKAKINYNISNNILTFLNSNIASNDKVVVQGDTRSAFYGALMAKAKGAKLYHIEAGLRTGDFNSPSPEEFYRVEIDDMADVCFCPTEGNAKNIKGKQKVFVTGNTIYPALQEYYDLKDRGFVQYKEKDKVVIVTIHRHENKKSIKNIVDFIIRMAKENREYLFKVIVHPNKILSSAMNFRFLPKNLKRLEPLDYEDMLNEIANAKMCITDSGGLQEECVALNTFCVVMRDKTERKEAVDFGYSILVNPHVKDISLVGMKSSITKKNPFFKFNCIDTICKEIKK